MEQLGAEQLLQESPPALLLASAPFIANVEIFRDSVFVPHFGHDTESLSDTLTRSSYLPLHLEQVYSKIGIPYSPLDKHLSKGPATPQGISLQSLHILPDQVPSLNADDALRAR